MISIHISFQSRQLIHVKLMCQGLTEEYDLGDVPKMANDSYLGKVVHQIKMGPERGKYVLDVDKCRQAAKENKERREAMAMKELDVAKTNVTEEDMQKHPQLRPIVTSTTDLHESVKRGDWNAFGQAYQDVVKATETLLTDNHHRPFALAVGAKDYARLIEQKEGQFAPELDSILRLCDDGVYVAPVIPEGKAVVLSTGDQNFDIAVAEDLNITFLGEQDQDYPFRVYECLVMRIKRPKAICTIE